MNKLQFGYKCKDIITGFEGILKTRGMFITGCDRIELVNKDGKAEWFDVPTTKILDSGVFEELQATNQCNMYDDIDEALYDFGVLAKDKITDFQGIIIAKSISISGDISYGLSPKFDKNSKENESIWFDEGRIEIVDNKKEEINTSSKRTGGAVPSLRIR